MQKTQQKIMQSFVDKLCDHMPMDRVKVLIDNGFDQWETITYMKGQQLLDLGFDTQQCIVVMVAANSNALENKQTQIFKQQQMQNIIALAKQNDILRQQEILKEQQQLATDKNKQGKMQVDTSCKSLGSAQQIKQHPPKDISEALLLKGTFTKSKPGEKPNLGKITMITLQQKQITHITNLDKCPHLSNLHLGNNFILKIEGLSFLTKLKMLKLQHNSISKIEGLEALVNLQHLYLTNNYISRLQNLQQNTKLQQIYISKQKINGNFTFDPSTTKALSYTLQKFQCNQSKVKNITDLKYLSVVKEVYLEKNELEDVGELSQTINGMQNLKTLSFKDNPLTKSQKYRDYLVILSKTLQELDGKKILQKERQYLVKLYALKHAKQAQDDKPKIQPKQKKMDLKGVRVEQQYAQYGQQANINKATDLRGNMPYANTKHSKK